MLAWPAARELLADYGDLAAIIDWILAGGEAVSFEVNGVDLRGEQSELLRLPPGSTLRLYDCLDEAERAELEAARPDLFVGED